MSRLTAETESFNAEFGAICFKRRLLDRTLVAGAGDVKEHLTRNCVSLFAISIQTLSGFISDLKVFHVLTRVKVKTKADSWI